MNTYSTKQVDHSLKTLGEIFEKDKTFEALPAASKQTFALALLQACKIKPKND